MAKQASASSQHEKQHHESESYMVTRTPDSKWSLTPEDGESLKRLAEMPDDQIRTDLIPELRREAWARAIKNPYAAKLREPIRRKAS